jgi:hypothetical protein
MTRAVKSYKASFIAGTVGKLSLEFHDGGSPITVILKLPNDLATILAMFSLNIPVNYDYQLDKEGFGQFFIG